MNFAALDLNLLRVFDAMMTEQNTTRAGQKVGLSQPAVSSALGRLRYATKDELFVRDGNRMVPTPKAQAMQAPVRAALQQLETTLSAIAGFDPATSEKRFVLLGSDYFSTLLMPALVSAVSPLAPGVTLQMLDFPSSEDFRLLSEGRIDIAVDRQLDPPEWICHETLFRSYILCVARRDHPVLRAAGIAPGERIPAKVYCSIPQTMLSMDGGTGGTIDPVLAEQGLQRSVTATMPHFHAVGLTAARSDLLGNLPVHFARYTAEILDLDTYLPPFDPPKMDVRMYWHRRMDQDEANSWLRGHVREAMKLDERFPPPADQRTDDEDWDLGPSGTRLPA